MKKFIFLIVAASCILLSCSKTDNSPYVTLSTPKVTVGYDSTNIDLQVNSNTDWHMGPLLNDWCTFSTTSGSGNTTIHVAIARNKSLKRRHGGCAIQNTGGDPQPFGIDQLGDTITGQPLGQIEIPYDGGFTFNSPSHGIYNASIVNDASKWNNLNVYFVPNGGAYRFRFDKILVLKNSDGSPTSMYMFCFSSSSEMIAGQRLMKQEMGDITEIVFSSKSDLVAAGFYYDFHPSNFYFGFTSTKINDKEFIIDFGNKSTSVARGKLKFRIAD